VESAASIHWSSAVANDKKSQQTDLSVLEAEYRQLLAPSQKLCAELTNQLGRLLSDSGIATGFPIQTRVKAWDSILRKIEGSHGRYTSVGDIQDIAGIRIILQFIRDVEPVIAIISSKLTVIKQYDAAARLGQDQFGYSSVHCVVSLPDEWTAVPTMFDLKDVKAEIQVRTLAQHIWAEASHRLQYKQEATVPGSVLRSIYRVSALLETVDLEFDRVLAEREAYRAELDVTQPDQLLNVDLLEGILDSALPEANKDQDEDYAYLLRDLAAFGITKVAELNELIITELEQAIRNDREYVRSVIESLDEEGGLSGTDRERLRRNVYYTHVGLVREMLSIRHRDEWSDYMYSRHDPDDST
jgi:ppGpp synthetase/RelA/SpoT-type nucleotidyltranferase